MYQSMTESPAFSPRVLSVGEVWDERIGRNKQHGAGAQSGI